MTLKLTKKQREALQQDPTKPLRVEDDETEKVYVILDEQALPSLWDEYIRRELQRGLDQLDRGEVEEWDVESFLAAAHRRHAKRTG